VFPHWQAEEDEKAPAEPAVGQDVPQVPRHQTDEGEEEGDCLQKSPRRQGEPWLVRSPLG
jgi:hypothetical protein